MINSLIILPLLYWNWIWPYLVEQGVLILEMWDVPRGPGRYHFNDTATNRPHIRWAAVVLASKYLWRSKCDCALHLSLELSRYRVVDYGIVTMFSCFLEATTHSCCGAKVWGRSHMTSGIDVGIFGPCPPCHYTIHATYQDYRHIAGYPLPLPVRTSYVNAPLLS